MGRTDELDGVRVGGAAGEVGGVLERGAAPIDGDDEGENEGGGGIDPPSELGGGGVGAEGEGVHEDIVQMVGVERLDLGRDGTEGEAVDRQGELGRERDGDGDECREVEWMLI